MGSQATGDYKPSSCGMLPLLSARLQLTHVAFYPPSDNLIDIGTDSLLTDIAGILRSVSSGGKSSDQRTVVGIDRGQWTAQLSAVARSPSASQRYGLCTEFTLFTIELEPIVGTDTGPHPVQ